MLVSRFILDLQEANRRTWKVDSCDSLFGDHCTDHQSTATPFGAVLNPRDSMFGACDTSEEDFDDDSGCDATNPHGSNWDEEDGPEAHV